MKYKTPEEALEAARPICAECKHCHIDDWGDYTCDRTLNYVADRVSGTTRARRTDCRKEREYTHGDSCGPLGKNFEQKDPEPVKPAWLERICAWFASLEDDEDDIL